MKTIILIIAATSLLGGAVSAKSAEQKLSGTCDSKSVNCGGKKAKTSLAGKPQIPLYNQETGADKNKDIPLYAPVASNKDIKDESETK